MIVPSLLQLLHVTVDFCSDQFVSIHIVLSPILTVVFHELLQLSLQLSLAPIKPSL